MRIPTEELVHQFQDRLYAAALCVCNYPEDAEDVVQDVLLKYHVSKKEFNDEDHLKAWLLRLVINRGRDLWRLRKSRESAPLSDFLSASNLSFNTEEDSDLFLAVMSLPPKYRSVIHLYYYEDYSVSAIAKLLRISESNTKARLFRARKELKQYLTEDD